MRLVQKQDAVNWDALMLNSFRDDFEESLLSIFFQKTLFFLMLPSPFMHPIFTLVNLNVSELKHVKTTLTSLA